VNLPDAVSPNALVTLFGTGICSVTRRIGSAPGYLIQKRNCISGGSMPLASIRTSLYPNPGRGMYNCQQNGLPVIAEEITIFNSGGLRAAQFTSTGQFNISHLPSGIYFYRLLIKNTPFTGKLIKL
jgi:hypothetical protein